MSEIEYFTYGNDLSDIFITYSATIETSDYGVERSPKLYHFTDIDVENIEILGVRVNLQDLPKDLQTAILQHFNQAD